MTGPSCPAGLPCVVGQLGPDLEAAQRFYAAIFGWSYRNIASGDDPPFLIAHLHGERVASLTAPEKPSTWIVAVSVEDRAAAIRIAAEAGGTSSPEETVDIATLGHFARLADPAGAEIHVMEPFPDCLRPRVSGPGAWAGSRLRVGDPAAVLPFYASLFGWRAEEAGATTVFRLPGHDDDVAVLERAGTGDARWTPEFWVADVDRAGDAALAHGGSVLHEPTAAAARRAVLADPGGGTFTVREWRDPSG